jgi:shikimate dehydrogenase
MTAGFRYELVGLLGCPVSENPTGPMMEAGFAAAGLPWRYLTLEVAPEKLGDAVRGARAMGFRGFHCTIPHKVTVRDHLDRIGPTAAHTGAVNCVVRHGDDLVGENTDGRGLLDCITQIADPAGSSAVVLGAGGAARAITAELAAAGVATITVVGRDLGRATQVRDLCERVTGPDGRTIRAIATRWTGDYQVPAECDLLVNATPVGMYPDIDGRLALAVDTIPRQAIVADVVANPLVTRLISAARERGCRTVTGADMLVAQAALSFQLWTGRPAPHGVLRDALLGALQR